MQNIQKSILNMVMQKWLNSDYLIIDTETTGLDNNALKLLRLQLLICMVMFF